MWPGRNIEVSGSPVVDGLPDAADVVLDRRREGEGITLNEGDRKVFPHRQEIVGVFEVLQEGL